jgi:hypothetical protein
MAIAEDAATVLEQFIHDGKGASHYQLSFKLTIDSRQPSG